MYTFSSWTFMMSTNLLYIDAFAIYPLLVYSLKELDEAFQGERYVFTLGENGETIVTTVEEYNGYVEAGEDAAFGRSADYMTQPIGDGPYYIVEQKPRFATTMGGLVIDTDLHVINKSGEVINGLYAAGEVVGGVMGDDSPSGANNGWAVTSGKLAAQSIAADLGAAAEEDEAA